jgi:hypothetical protein
MDFSVLLLRSWASGQPSSVSTNPYIALQSSGGLALSADTTLRALCSIPRAREHFNIISRKPTPKTKQLQQKKSHHEQFNCNQ